MKNFLYIPLFYYFFFCTKLITFAGNTDAGVFQGSGLTPEKLRKGDIHIDDIPNVIRALIDYLMGIAGTISVIFIIIGAYQMLFGSLEGSNNKGKDTIIMALTGFAIAALSWFIVKLVFDNFS